MIGNRSVRNNSFATCRVYSNCGSDENRRWSGRLQLRPYFGHFSGLWVTFDIRRSLNSGGNHKIKVRIEGCPDSRTSSINLRHQSSLDLTKSVTRVKIKDLCLQYVHSTKPPNIEFQHNPCSLAFLCEKKVLLNLNEIDSSILPPLLFSHLNPSTFSTQDVIIKVWFGSSRCLTRIERMKVRQGISVAELQWMLCRKLVVKIEPSKLDIYDYKSMEKLSETSYLTPHQAIFHCVVLPSIHRDSIIVSLVGRDIGQIKVESRDLTLNQFQSKIKETFGLLSSSFIFIPQVYRSKNVRKCNHVAMSAVLDKSTLPLIDNKRRNLPLIDNTPLTLLEYEELNMSKLTLSELSLFSSNLVCAYEVTGPTIPISYRTSTTVGKGEFSLISDRLHAISINLTWSVQTLLRYIEEISHFPCENIYYRESVLPHTSLLQQYFADQHWRTKSTDQIDGAPIVVNSITLGIL